MADSVLSGGKALQDALAAIAAQMGGGQVRVGFMAGATYPDGTSVAAVAAQNEYGNPANNQPPRPFFRRMIAKESPTWADKMARLAASTNYDGPTVLALMGEDVKGALQQNINEFREPKLADSTVRSKGFDKPLIHTSHMINSVDYEVDTP